MNREQKIDHSAFIQSLNRKDGLFLLSNSDDRKEELNSNSVCERTHNQGNYIHNGNTTVRKSDQTGNIFTGNSQ